jgi:dihydrolipoamide dehydrogenase
VYARLGSKVSFIEFADSMIPTMDKTMGKESGKQVERGRVRVRRESSVV